LEERLRGLSADELQKFNVAIGNITPKTVEEQVRKFALHPENERRICQLLNRVSPRLCRGTLKV
jgi:hypothetical protein